VAELVQDQYVLALAVLRAPDQGNVALAGRNARERNARGVHAGSFLTHEGARRPAYAVHDGDIAGKQVRKLREEQGRAQAAHQLLVEQARRGISLGLRGQDRAIDGEIALAAAGGDHHVHAAEDFLVALDAGRFQREARGVGADALPGFHLALISLCRELGVDIDASGLKRVPVRIQPLAERGGKSDAGDPDFRWFPLQRWRRAHGCNACWGKPMRLATASMWPRSAGLGKGMWLKVIVALLRSLPATFTLASVIA